MLISQKRQKIMVGLKLAGNYQDLVFLLLEYGFEFCKFYV